MAKSKKKTKSHKSNKAVKSVKTKPASKKSVAAKKKTVVAASPARNRTPVALAIGVCLIVVFVFASGVFEQDKPRAIQSSAKPTTNQNAQQTIEVTDPNSDKQPEATGYELQGSSPTGQQAQGGLQKPQTGDQLQPNAKIKNYENVELE